MKFWSFQPTSGAPDEVDLIVYGYIVSSASESDFWGSDDDVGAKQFREELDANKTAKRINVRINSFGGDAFAGIAIHNMLAAHPAEIVATVEGVAASAASIIAMAGRPRTIGGVRSEGRVRMATGALMMVHNPSSIAMGESSDLRKTADVLDMLQGSLASIYRAKCGKGEEELRQMLDAETWLSAEDAVTQGLADEVVADQVAAVEARGEQVFLNAVGFPADKLPAQLRARLAASVAPPPAAVEQPAPVAVAPAPLPAPQPLAITRELLTAQAPDLLASLLAEGKAAGLAEGHAAGLAEGKAQGIQAERERIRAIEASALPGHGKLVIQAKYGTPAAEGQAAVEPLTPEAFHAALLQAERGKRDQYLVDAAADADAARIPGGAAPTNADADEAQRRHLVKVGAQAGSTGNRRQ